MVPDCICLFFFHPATERWKEKNFIEIQCNNNADLGCLLEAYICEKRIKKRCCMINESTNTVPIISQMVMVSIFYPINGNIKRVHRAAARRNRVVSLFVI